MFTLRSVLMSVVNYSRCLKNTYLLNRFGRPLGIKQKYSIDSCLVILIPINNVKIA